MSQSAVDTRIRGGPDWGLPNHPRDWKIPEDWSSGCIQEYWFDHAGDLTEYKLYRPSYSDYNDYYKVFCIRRRKEFGCVCRGMCWKPCPLYGKGLPVRCPNGTLSMGSPAM